MTGHVPSFLMSVAFRLSLRPIAAEELLSAATGHQ
jgi:hypothetical protein